MPMGSGTIWGLQKIIFGEILIVGLVVHRQSKILHFGTWDLI
jgi:hypothetical protein